VTLTLTAQHPIIDPTPSELGQGGIGGEKVEQYGGPDGCWGQGGGGEHEPSRHIIPRDVQGVSGLEEV